MCAAISAWTRSRSWCAPRWRPSIPVSGRAGIAGITWAGAIGLAVGIGLLADARYHDLRDKLIGFLEDQDGRLAS